MDQAQARALLAAERTRLQRLLQAETIDRRPPCSAMRSTMPTGATLSRPAWPSTSS
jgi:hypothetical protein